MSDQATINMDPRANAGAALWRPREPVIAIAAGARHNLVLTADGTVHASGENDAGQCEVPRGLSNVVAIGAGYRHSLAVRSDGSVIGWGDNRGGQLDIPAGLSDVQSVTGGVCHSVGLTNGGSVVSWGTTKTQVPHVQPQGLSEVTAVASGWWSTFAITESSLVVWGTNAEFGPVKEHPVVVAATGAGSSVVGVAARHSPFAAAIALLATGKIVEDGYGHGSFSECHAANVAMGAARNAVQVAAGESHSVALLDDGAVIGWGGSAVRETAPTGLSGVVAVAAGSDHTLALRADGSVVVWGKNGYQQLMWPLGFDGEIVGWERDGYYLPQLGFAPPAQF